jgi:hypothetical protein
MHRRVALARAPHRDHAAEGGELGRADPSGQFCAWRRAAAETAAGGREGCNYRRYPASRFCMYHVDCGFAPHQTRESAVIAFLFAAALFPPE